MSNYETVDENGITIKKFFRSILIPYTDILSIVADHRNYHINTRNGEEYDTEVPPNHVALLLQYIVEYNIDFRDMNELSDGEQIYTYDEALQVAKKTSELIRRYANDTVAMQLGKEYSIETGFYDKVDTFSGVDLILMKDGRAVELPRTLKDFYDQTAPGAFDQIDLFYGPVLLDAEHRCAKYGVTEECVDDKICEKTIFECVSDFCVRYKRELNT